MEYKKPLRLKLRDTVGIVSPSWGGPSIFPHIYENGLKVLKELGLQIKEYPTARADNDFLSKNPEARAKDINDAFADSEVKAIFASIGGEDSVRILPFLNKEVIQNNPKILIGYSDTTTLLTYLNQLGLVTFHGPSIMAGFSQAESLPESFTQHIQQMLFSPQETYEYSKYSVYCDGYLDWGQEENLGKTKELKQDNGWRFIQGSSVVTGELYGGCIEVLEFMNGTDFWPEKDFWNGKVLFFETSEEKPSIQQVQWKLRNYGMQGIFDKVSAVLFGRARDYSDEEKNELDLMIVNVIKEEFGNAEIPIVTNMDFGHTDPQIILPLGIKAEVDCLSKTFKLIESPLQ
ncbi:MAG: LD-carboxypeptidase [Candidatus Pacebacteria bacterium]|nr:LD-carboxypeptidase [Candidatus Paceibacterota bacterium]MBP9700773.1 LD-carboxypeptidase [Candidatus Paceibacterota bacterium]